MDVSAQKNPKITQHKKTQASIMQNNCTKTQTTFIYCIIGIIHVVQKIERN